MRRGGGLVKTNWSKPIGQTHLVVNGMTRKEGQGYGTTTEKCAAAVVQPLTDKAVGGAGVRDDGELRGGAGAAADR